MIYLDTGCLLKLYYPEPESARVARLVADEAIAFVGMHELELANALQLKVFRREATTTQVRMTEALVQDDARAGVLHRPLLPWDEVWREASSMARAHTRALGCRSLDIVHCAAARLLSADSFVTTDSRQRKLAVKVGLKCPSV